MFLFHSLFDKHVVLSFNIQLSTAIKVHNYDEVYMQTKNLRAALTNITEYIETYIRHANMQTVVALRY